MGQGLVLIKGAGDIASGVAFRLWRAGFPVVMTELVQPLVIRRAVSFAQAVYAGEVNVEGVTACRARDTRMALAILLQGKIPVLTDSTAAVVYQLRPAVLVDGIMAKKNSGTSIDDAPLVIGLGPGFVAGRDVHAVIETQRGHYLGRVLWQGSAAPNTGVPGNIGGYTGERLLRAPGPGTFHALKSIGDMVAAGETVAVVGDLPVKAQINGVLRGILHDGLPVAAGMKVGDVDPRGERAYCFTISEKALAVGGGVLEAILGAGR